MPQRNIISYNTLIGAYARSPDSAFYTFGLLTQMRYECIRPNGSTFTSMVQLASAVGDWFLGLAFHCQVVKSGLLFDAYVQSALIGLYSCFGDMGSANEVFGSVIVKDDVAWNCIILGNLKNDRIREGLCLFKTMLNSGVVATEFTYSMVLNACARLGDYTCGRLVHARVIRTGVPLDLPLQNALVDIYSSCGDTQSAFHVFDGIHNRDLVSWNSLMAGYAEKGEGEKAINLFVQMQHQCAYKPDEYTFAAVISAVKGHPAPCYGEPLHARVIVCGLDESLFVGSPLIFMYFENGRTESAEVVFHSITNKDMVLWTEMISGYSKTMEGEKAVKFFYDMWKAGYKIDDFALSSALGACADLASLRQGEMLHCQAIKAGYNSEMSVRGSLIDTYAKNGKLQDAKQIFTEVQDLDLKCWNSMIGGYSLHGKPEDAIKLFDGILDHGLEPDQVTFISLLSACSHCGLVDKGKYIWNYMKEKGVNPGLKHYSCMVSLLSRAGLLEEAAEIINESCFGESHLELWRIVLSSSVSNKNLSVGLHAAGEILRFNTEDSGTLALLSNLYAAAGRWDSVIQTRKKIRGLMLEKYPGLSWVETVKSLDVFSSVTPEDCRSKSTAADIRREHGIISRY